MVALLPVGGVQTQSYMSTLTGNFLPIFKTFSTAFIKQNKKETNYYTNCME